VTRRTRRSPETCRMHDAGVQLPLLLQPIALRGTFARNRIVVSPMCQYKSESGGPTDWHLVTLGKYSIGGAGIVFTEETAVEERGRKTYECAGIYSDGHVSAYRRITDFIRGQGAIPAIQLGHAGRKASSDLPWNDFKPLDRKRCGTRSETVARNIVKRGSGPASGFVRTDPDVGR
jgi:2,4-dienoyl-CoA reductase-like NADH-dependent reductase (Old Yellow Enzyme family)